MARPVTGLDHVEAARALLRGARSADELRIAQAVLLPLELGLSIEQTALAIGRSRSVTSRLRARFLGVAAGVLAEPRRKTDLRNRAHIDFDDERALIDEALRCAAAEGISDITRMRVMFEARLGKAVALSTVYRMLARHGWRRSPPKHRPASVESGKRAGAKRFGGWRKS